MAKRGFSDIEIDPSGGYNPTGTPADAAVLRAQLSLYRRLGLDPLGGRATRAPTRATSSPTSRSGWRPGTWAWATAAAPTRPTRDPKVAGWDDAVMSHVLYLHELATIA